MTYEAVVRFTPAYDTRHLVGSPADAPEMLVSTDALNKPKLHEPVPVVIDHDLEREIGRVESVFIGEDVDYGTRVRKWWFAACELDEKPDWLKRGCGVSWSWNPLHEYTATASTTVLTSCIFREISLLSPGRRPAEPLARVSYVKPSVTRHHAEPEGEVIFGHGQMLYRPSIGTVTGVR